VQVHVGESVQTRSQVESAAHVVAHVALVQLKLQSAPVSQARLQSAAEQLTLQLDPV
jgi:hypothetical protein